jgi:hypothetical protein
MLNRLISLAALLLTSPPHGRPSTPNVAPPAPAQRRGSARPTPGARARVGSARGPTRRPRSRCRGRLSARTVWWRTHQGLHPGNDRRAATRRSATTMAGHFLVTRTPAGSRKRRRAREPLYRNRGRYCSGRGQGRRRRRGWGRWRRDYDNDGHIDLFVTYHGYVALITTIYGTAMRRAPAASRLRPRWNTGRRF